MEHEILNKLEEIKMYSLIAAKDMLTIQECAILTGLTVAYLYKLTSKKMIPHYKPQGKHLYFDRKEITAWMRSGRVSTAEEVEAAASAYIVRKKTL